MFIMTLISVFSQSPSEHALAHAIQKIAPRFKKVDYRKKYSRQYASRILIEAKRRKLDPIALVAVAWTESNFVPWVKSKTKPVSFGVWQLIPFDSPVVAARKTLRGCKVPKNLPGWLRSVWARRRSGGTCEDQSVADRRERTGGFLESELRDYIIGTYVVAFEIRMHIDTVNRMRIKPRLIPGCGLSRQLQRKLYQYGHYNTGPRRPRRYYVYRLCKRYETIVSWITAFSGRVSK